MEPLGDNISIVDIGSYYNFEYMTSQSLKLRNLKQKEEICGDITWGIAYITNTKINIYGNSSENSEFVNREFLIGMWRILNVSIVDIALYISNY